MLYDFSWISLKRYRSVIARDLSEAATCKENEAFKAANILLGSSMEGLLLYALHRARIPLPKSASLNKLLEYIERKSLLPSYQIYFGHAMRECRNLVHPQKCIDENYEVTADKTDLLFHMYNELLAKLHNNLQKYLPVGMRPMVLIDKEQYTLQTSPFVIGSDDNCDALISRSSIGEIQIKIVYDENSNNFYLCNTGCNNVFFTETQKTIYPQQKIVLPPTCKFSIANEQQQTFLDCHWQNKTQGENQ